eukprot:409603_1
MSFSRKYKHKRSRSKQSKRSADPIIKLKSSRKPRIIKNGIVKVDDVSTAAGVKNINWLNIARLKLIKRELILLHQKQKVLDQVITSAIQTFANQNTKRFRFSPLHACRVIYDSQIKHKLVLVSSVIMRQCSQSLAIVLMNWRGYKPDTESASFRHYFKHCRCWFDAKKSSTIAIHFWTPIMIIIDEFVAKTATRLFGNQTMQNRTVYQTFCDSLNALILQSVFEAKLKVPNTRSLWLVAASSYSVFLEENNSNSIRIAIADNTANSSSIRSQYLECVTTRRVAFDRLYYDAMTHSNYLKTLTSGIGFCGFIESKQSAGAALPYLHAECTVITYDNGPSWGMSTNNYLHYLSMIRRQMNPYK